MASTVRTIRVRFDGTAKGLIKAAAEAGIAIESVEKQAKKSSNNIAKQTGTVFGQITDTLGALPSQLKGAAIVAAVAIGAAMAPAVASAIISGVLLAVGGGGLIAGIIGAAKSPKVAKAWQRLGRQGEVVFERFSKPFIKPLERAATTFGRALARAEPTINRIGQTLAPIIDKLAPAFAGLAENALPGILAASQASVMLFDTLAANLPGIGGSLGLFFQVLAQGVPVANAWFDRFLKWTQDMLPKLAGFLVWVQDLGVKMDTFTKGPEFTGMVSALTSFKDNVLVGVKKGFDDIKISVADNSGTWKQLATDIREVVRLLGPVFQQAVNNVMTGVAFMVQVFARLYDAVSKVLNIVIALVRGLDRLPGNLSGGNTHVELGTIQRRARGGPAVAGRSYLVGDGGEPEILTMGRQSGYITPMSQAGQPAYSDRPIIVENHIEIGGEVVRVVRTEISESDRRTKRAVLAGAGAR